MKFDQLTPERKIWVEYWVKALLARDMAYQHRLGAHPAPRSYEAQTLRERVASIAVNPSLLATLEKNF